MVDQMHHRAVSAYGNPHVSTPNLDRMIQEGTSFMKMHTIMPMCCPARASWMTGRTSKEHGIVMNDCPINPEFPDLAQWFRKHSDYETVYTGKWHIPNRLPEDSFDKVLIHEKVRVGEMLDAPVARSSVAYLQNKKDDKPFFLCISFLNPHDCCFTGGAAGGLGKFELSDTMKDRLPPLPKGFRFAKNPYIQSRTKGWDRTDWRYYIYSYYRMVEAVDAEIGMVCDAVRNSRFADNTLVIFTSDHGDGLAFHGNLSKGILEDEAWRVPAVVCGKDVPSGVLDEEHLASGLDIPATICDYAGLPPLPKANLAKSWRPVLEGRAEKWREYVVGETPHPYRGIAFRDNQETKTIFYNDGTVDVYDMGRDPQEFHNLSGTPRGEEIVKRHRGYLADYLSKITLSPKPTLGPLRKDEEKMHWYDYIEWYEQLREDLAHEPA